MVTGNQEILTVLTYNAESFVSVSDFRCRCAFVDVVNFSPVLRKLSLLLFLFITSLGLAYSFVLHCLHMVFIVFTIMMLYCSVLVIT